MTFRRLPLAAAVLLGAISSAAGQGVYPDYLFHPVPPCRVFDTAGAGKLEAGETRAFQIAGSDGFAEQGGKSGGCDVPSYASMVSLSLTTSAPATKGFAALAPAADGTKLRLVSFDKGAAATGSANAMLSQGKLYVFASASAHVEGVVTGYFAPQIWATIRAEGTRYSTTGRMISSRRLSVGVYEVTADREIHICGAVATVSLPTYYATAITDLPPKSYVTVKVFDRSGQPADAPFTVLVTC